MKMATPQYATAIVQSGATGKRHIYRTYFSDAAGAATFPDGTSSITFPAKARLVDLIFAATLATTPTLTINVGGLPVTILNTATMTAATIVRPLQQAPIEIPMGSSLNIVQS
jgi:hypothetical protein